MNGGDIEKAGRTAEKPPSLKANPELYNKLKQKLR